jgi:hypothetical protein
VTIHAPRAGIPIRLSRIGRAPVEANLRPFPAGRFDVHGEGAGRPAGPFCLRGHCEPAACYVRSDTRIADRPVYGVPVHECSAATPTCQPAAWFPDAPSPAQRQTAPGRTPTRTRPSGGLRYSDRHKGPAWTPTRPASGKHGPTADRRPASWLKGRPCAPRPRRTPATATRRRAPNARGLTCGYGCPCGCAPFAARFVGDVAAVRTPQIRGDTDDRRPCRRGLCGTARTGLCVAAPVAPPPALEQPGGAHRRTRGRHGARPTRPLVLPTVPYRLTHAQPQRRRRPARPPQGTILKAFVNSHICAQREP